MASNYKKNNAKNSAYIILAKTLEDVKNEKISVKAAMHRLKLSDRPERPFAKVTKMGAVALFGITAKPIVLYESQWNRLMKTVESGYIRKYMEYNADRISHGPAPRNADGTEVVPEAQAEAQADADGVAEVLSSSVATEEVAADA